MAIYRLTSTFKKILFKLTALAVLAASGASFAQSSVSLTGGMTLGFGITDLGTASSGAQIARQTGNLNFAGTEDLGGGLKASFKFQTTLGTVASTNTSVSNSSATQNNVNQRTLLGDRGAALTLSGDFGSAAVGRDNTAVRSLWGAIGDVSQLAVISGLSASSSSESFSANGGLAVAGGDANARVIYGDSWANAVSYTSPAFNGFQVSVGMVPVQAADTNIGTDVATKDTMSYSVTYAAGPLSAGYNYTDSKGGSAPYSLSTALASYDLGVAKFGVTYQTVDLASGTNPGAGIAVTAAMPMGAGNLGLGWGKRSAAAQTGSTFGDDVQQTFVGYRYNLSKRTNVQLVWNKIDRAGTTTDVTEKHVLLAHTF